MSYNLGASPSRVDAERAAADAKAILLTQFDRFASIIMRGASDIESGSIISFQAGNPVLARAMRDSVPRLRAGIDNVLAGRTAPDVWSGAVTRLIAQVRQEAPWFSITTLSSAGDTLVNAVKLAASTAAAAAIATGATAGKTVKAFAEGAGVDVQKTIDAASSTVKYVAVAVGLLAVAYLAFILPKSSRK